MPAKQHVGFSHGIIVPKQQSSLAPPSPPRKMEVTSYPSDALQKLDRLLSGHGPTICISRMGGGIGDVLMTTPTVRAIKKKYPGCKLIYATDFGYLNGALVKVLQGNPYIDELIDGTKIKSANQFDVYINLHCPCIAHEQPGAKPIHRIDLFARHAGVELDSPQIDFLLTEEEKRWGAEFLFQRKIRKDQWIVLVNPFASHADRQWGLDRWQRMIGYLTSINPDIRVIIITHESDHDKSKKWDLVHTTQMHNYDVRCIAAVMANCHLTICPDSALLHVGQALNLRILALFGQTDYRARTCYSPNTTVICPGASLSAFPQWYKAGHARTISWNMIDPEQTALHTIKVLRETYGESPTPSTEIMKMLADSKQVDSEQSVVNLTSKVNNLVIPTEDI